MAEKVSLKIFIVISFLCGILSACMPPVDIQTFMEDDEVKEVIKATQVTVIVGEGSDKDLKGGKGVISGLVNKYYMVEKEFDEDGTTEITSPLPTDIPYPWYVTEREDKDYKLGEITSDLGVISKITKGKIINLKNKHTYIVRSAVKFPNTVSFTYNDSGPGATANQKVDVDDNGVISIPTLTGTGNITLNITDGLIAGNNYEIMAVAASTTTTSTPKWNTFSAPDTSKEGLSTFWDAIPIEGPGTTVDYVIVNKTDPKKFNVLTVKTPVTITTKVIQGVTPPVTGETPVSSITSTEQYTGVVAWDKSLNDGKFAAEVIYTATITLTPKQGYTLQGIPINFFTVAGTDSPATNPVNSGIITAKFPKTTKPEVIINEVTFTVENLAKTPTLSQDHINRGTFNGNNYVTLTLVPPSGKSWDLNSIKWSIGEISDDDVALNVDPNGVLKITNSGVFLPIFAANTIDISVYATLDGIIPYSATVSLDVKN
jgi:hypothetical protein